MTFEQRYIQREAAEQDIEELHAQVSSKITFKPAVSGQHTHAVNIE